MTVPAGERGTTTVAPRAVRRIAERAAAEALPDGGSVTRGSATVRGASARIAVDVRLPYPVRADEAAQRVRERAEARTAALTGLSVPRAAVRVDALTVAAAPAMVTHGAPGAPGAPGVSEAVEAVEAPEMVPGPWIRAERRAPSAVLAVAGAVACGLVLADVVAVRLGGAPAGWRTAVLDWAAAHGPADSAVRVGGAVAALAGVWLLGCALLPGRGGGSGWARPHRSCGRSWTVRLRPASCASGRSASPGWSERGWASGGGGRGYGSSWGTANRRRSARRRSGC